MKKHFLFTAITVLCFMAFAPRTNAQISTDAFVTVWTADANNSIVFPGIGSNYTIDVYDAAGITLLNTYTGNGTTTIPNLIAGTDYTIVVVSGSGSFTGFGSKNVNGFTDASNLLQVTQWGTTAWTSLDFTGCGNLTVTAPDLANVSGITDMSRMFEECYSLTTVPNMDEWNVSNVTDMSSMFSGDKAFNQPIGDWNTGKVTDMSSMFEECYSLITVPNMDKWNVSNVTDMSYMFDGAMAFNQPLNGWNTSNVIDMVGMFYYALAFNQPLNNWNTGNVTDMSLMFRDASSFNQPIDDWNTGKVTDMSDMFSCYDVFGSATFNQPLNDWNVSNVTDMGGMFNCANAFNQPLTNWDVSKVTNMNGMFADASSFNQSLGSWNLSSVLSNAPTLGASGMDCNNYSSTLIGWAANLGFTTPPNLTLDAFEMQYGAYAANARNALLAADWTIYSDAPGSCTALPITLLNFTAQAQNNTIAVLQWTTATESNNKGFEIQRSADGASWQDITFVNSKAANGNSSEQLNYQYTDQKPLSGYNYYRLKQQDLDGMASYSCVQEVTFGAGVQLYPNPATSILTVQISGAAKNVVYELVSVSGGVVQKGILQNGKNNLPVSNLANGVYFLQVVAGGVKSSYEVGIAK